MLTICYDPYAGTLGKFTRAEIFDLAAEAGYEGINIPVNSGFLGELSTAEIDDAVSLAEKHNLVAPTIGFGNHILTTPDRLLTASFGLQAAPKGEALQHFEIVLKVAHRFNAEIIGVWVNPVENVSRQESLDVLADNLSQMIPACNENGIKIALEFEKGCPLDNYREGVAFVEGTGLQVYLTCDTYHLFNDGAEPHTATHAMKACLGDVHVSGSNRGEPGGGVFDFETFAQGLKEIGFSGPLVVQYKMEDVASIKRSCEFTKKFRVMIQA